MSNEKFTQGEWYQAISPETKKAYIGAKKTHYIAEVLTHEWDFEETEANAKLIAAAPELLEACQRALQVLDSENIFGQARLLLAVAIKKAVS